MAAKRTSGSPSSGRPRASLRSRSQSVSRKSAIKSTSGSVAPGPCPFTSSGSVSPIHTVGCFVQPPMYGPITHAPGVAQNGIGAYTQGMVPGDVGQALWPGVAQSAPGNINNAPGASQGVPGNINHAPGVAQNSIGAYGQGMAPGGVGQAPFPNVQVPFPSAGQVPFPNAGQVPLTSFTLGDVPMSGAQHGGPVSIVQPVHQTGVIGAYQTSELPMITTASGQRFNRSCISTHLSNSPFQLRRRPKICVCVSDRKNVRNYERYSYNPNMSRM